MVVTVSRAAKPLRKAPLPKEFIWEGLGFNNIQLPHNTVSFYTLHSKTEQWHPMVNMFNYLLQQGSHTDIANATHHTTRYVWRHPHNENYTKRLLNCQTAIFISIKIRISVINIITSPPSFSKTILNSINSWLTLKILLTNMLYWQGRGFIRPWWYMRDLSVVLAVVALHRPL